MVSSRTTTIRGKKYTVALDERTSERLAGIRRKGTKPEEEVRRVLRKHGIRFTTSTRTLPGSPDFANRSERWAIFVHGCFWHHHTGCTRATIPTKNREFWLAKFEDNRRRDRRVAQELRKLGYRVLTIWECATRKPESLERRLKKLQESVHGERNG